MSSKNLFTYIFVIIALLFEGFFGTIPFVLFVLQIILLSFAIFLLLWVFRRGARQDWKKVILEYIIIGMATVGFFMMLFLTFIGYQYIVPGVISDITLSHSGQQVVFIEMSHIATPKFYQQKKSTLESLTQSGYTLLIEGVKPGTASNQALFAQSLGFDLTPSLYSDIASLIDLMSQDNKFLFANVSTGSLISVDLSIDDIMNLMGTGGISFIPKALPDLSLEIKTLGENMSVREQLFFGWVGRGLLNWGLKRSGNLDMILSSPDQSRLFSTIIDRRNDAIVTYIQTHPNQNIAIIYGALHFNGVYEALQKSSIGWVITHITSSAPYSL